jgi:Rit1 N-terminal domain
VTPESDLDFTLSDEYYSVILLTASSLVPCGHQRIRGFVYIQGAADDEESWSNGLTSPQFWDHYEQLLNCTQEDELVNTIQDIIGSTVLAKIKEELSPVDSTSISLGVGTMIPEHATIMCSSEGDSVQENARVLYLRIPRKSKLLSIMTQTLFPAAISFAVKHHILNHSPLSIKATDPSRQSLDLSIAVTLVLLCLFFDAQGIFQSIMFNCRIGKR